MDSWSVCCWRIPVYGWLMNTKACHVLQSRSSLWCIISPTCYSTIPERQCSKTTSSRQLDKELDTWVCFLLVIRELIQMSRIGAMSAVQTTLSKEVTRKHLGVPLSKWEECCWSGRWRDWKSKAPLSFSTDYCYTHTIHNDSRIKRKWV